MCITGDVNIKANSGECSTFESKPDAFLPYVLFVLSLYRDLVPVQIQNLRRGRRNVETSCTSILFCRLCTLLQTYPYINCRRGDCCNCWFSLYLQCLLGNLDSSYQKYPWPWIGCGSANSKIRDKISANVRTPPGFWRLEKSSKRKPTRNSIIRRWARRLNTISKL